MDQDHYVMMAHYNCWANKRVLDACVKLGQDALDQPRSAFFPSIMNTLNHIMVADRIWLSRLRQKPEVMALDTVLFDKIDDFKTAREKLDTDIVAYFKGLAGEIPEGEAHYKTTSGQSFSTPFGIIYTHLFNHQTHHRGQLHSMLFEAGAGSLALDLIYFQREIAEGKH